MDFKLVPGINAEWQVVGHYLLILPPDGLPFYFKETQGLISIPRSEWSLDLHSIQTNLIWGLTPSGINEKETKLLSIKWVVLITVQASKQVLWMKEKKLVADFSKEPSGFLSDFTSLSMKLHRSQSTRTAITGKATDFRSFICDYRSMYVIHF